MAAFTNGKMIAHIYVYTHSLTHTQTHYKPQ